MRIKSSYHHTNLSVCLNSHSAKKVFEAKLSRSNNIDDSEKPKKKPTPKQISDDFNQAKFYLGGAALMVGGVVAISAGIITAPAWVPELLTAEAVVLSYNAFKKLDEATGMGQ